MRQLEERASRDEEETAALLRDIAEVKAQLARERALEEEEDCGKVLEMAESEVRELKAQLAAAQREKVAQPEKAPMAADGDETNYSGRGGESFFSSSAEVWFNRKNRLSMAASPRNVAASRRLRQQKASLTQKARPQKAALLNVNSDSDSDGDPYADILNAAKGRR